MSSFDVAAYWLDNAFSAVSNAVHGTGLPCTGASVVTASPIRSTWVASVRMAGSCAGPRRLVRVEEACLERDALGRQIRHQHSLHVRQRLHVVDAEDARVVGDDVVFLRGAVAGARERDAGKVRLADSVRFM